MAKSSMGGCVICGCEEANLTAQFNYSGGKITASFCPLDLPSMLLTVWLTAVRVQVFI